MNDPANILEGKLEVLAHRRGELFYHEFYKNIILYQGQAEIIRALASAPVFRPRVIARMAVGDQGAKPSDPTVPKEVDKTKTELFHEVYRKDVDARALTLYSSKLLNYAGNTVAGSNIITELTSTADITLGMVVEGTGIPAGAVVTVILGPNSLKISLNATTTDVGQTITFRGVVNECVFSATFNAIDVPIEAFSNPAQPRINEVGLVIIDPAAAVLPRAPVAAPNQSGVQRVARLTRDSSTLTEMPDTTGIVPHMQVTGFGIQPNTTVLASTANMVSLSQPVTADADRATLNFTDEVLMTIRTLKSVPFEAANDISITIRYTVYTE